MRLSFRVVAWVALAAVLLTCGTGPAGPNEKTARLLSGTWDFARRQKGLPVLVIIRQDNNIYPSIWGGRNVANRVTVAGIEDDLTDDLKVSSKGGFKAAIVLGPRKQGMDKIIPGGIWSRSLKDGKFFVDVTGFRDWKIVAHKRDDQTIRLEGKFSSVFSTPTGQMPLEGTAVANISKRVDSLQIVLTATFKGADVGLADNQAGPLTLTLTTNAPSSTDVPEVDGGKADLPPTD